MDSFFSNPLFMSGVVGLVSFFAAYFSFDLWHAKLRTRLLRDHKITFDIFNSIQFGSKLNADSLFKNQLLLGSAFAIMTLYSGTQSVVFSFFSLFFGGLFPILFVTKDVEMQWEPQKEYDLKQSVSTIALVRGSQLIRLMASGFVIYLVGVEMGVNILGALIASWFSFRMGFLLPGIYVAQVKKAKRVTEFNRQLVDALILMQNALKAGLSTPQAMQVVVDEMPAPVCDEFALVLNENKVGLSLEQAFENFGKRMPTEEVQMLVSSVIILNQTGGNLAETFGTITNVIRERLKLENKIKAMVAQGMTSAMIITLMPWALFGLLFVIDQDMMMPMVTHPLGWGILFTVLILELIGFFVIMKIVRIRV